MSSDRLAGSRQPRKELLRAARPHREPRQRSRRVISVLTALCVFASGFLIWRLVDLQILNGQQSRELADQQHTRRKTEMPQRGQIFDRNGVLLASSTYVYRVGITPRAVVSRGKAEDGSKATPSEIAQRVAAILDIDAAKLFSYINPEDPNYTRNMELPYVQLKTEVTGTQRKELLDFLKAKEIRNGFAIDAEPRRAYSNGSLASQVIGFTRYDNGYLVGQLGIELQYNELLTGKPGVSYAITDNFQSKSALPFAVPADLQVQHGADLVLNIDINVQKIIQEELMDAVARYEITNGASAIIMNPYTGAVLGMASYPFFDSGNPTAAPAGKDPATWKGTDSAGINYLSSQIWRNRAISDAYEPGSTFKALTGAIAIEEDVRKSYEAGIPLEKVIFSDAPLAVGAASITCSYTPHHGNETMEQAFLRSCNPVFAQLSQRIGLTRFYDYVAAFGFRSLTGIDLPGEGTGLLHAKPTEIDMVTLSYGESSTVTPLQMITSYCAFANGGYLMRPQVVKSIQDPSGYKSETMVPETMRQVISEETSIRIRRLLEEVVKRGTGTSAYVEGYSVAGKTSTSTDEEGFHTLSFCGFAPSVSPKAVALVVLDKPRDKELQSSAAARTFGNMMRRVLDYLGVQQKLTDADVSNLTKLYTVPDLSGKTYADAIKLLNSLKLNGQAGEAGMGGETKVQAQWPPAGTKLLSRSLVYLYPNTVPEESVTIPDFHGRSLSESLTLAAEYGLNISIRGNPLGYVTRQDPAPTNNRPQDPQTTPSPSAAVPVTPTPSAGTAHATPAPGQPEPVRSLRRGDSVQLTLVAIEEGGTMPTISSPSTQATATTRPSASTSATTKPTAPSASTSATTKPTAPSISTSTTLKTTAASTAKTTSAPTGATSVENTTTAVSPITTQPTSRVTSTTPSAQTTTTVKPTTTR